MQELPTLPMGVVTIIKKTRNYRNDQSVVNAYYQALKELRELSKANIASETASVTGSSRGISTLDHIWYNIKNFWKGKKKVELKETEEPKECYHIPPSLLLIENLFKEVLFKPVFDPLKLEEGILEFRKRKDEGILSKDLA